MMHSHGFLIAALLGLGVVYAAYRAVQSVPHDAPPAARGATSVPRPVELAQPRREVPRPGLEFGAPNDPRGETEHGYQAYLAGVDAAFQQEPLDARWASATSSMVRDALAGNHEVLALAHDVECRSHTCRVQIADDGSGELAKRVPMFFQRVGQELPGIVAHRVEDPGEAALVVYLSRPGAARVP